MTDIFTKMLRIVRESDDLVMDTETSGLDWKRNTVVGWVLGDGTPDHTHYAPLRHGGGGNLPDPSGHQHALDAADGPYVPHTFEIELAKAFKERARVKTFGRIKGHHIKFDAHMALNVGVSFGRNLLCTQNQEGILDEFAREYGLEACALRHKLTAKKGSEMYEHIAKTLGVPNTKKAMSEFWRMPGNDPVVIDYSVGDGITTMELAGVQQEEIDNQENQHLFDMENDLIWTLVRIERKGIKVDTEHLNRVQDELQTDLDEALAQLPENFNPRSPLQLKEYCSQFNTDWPMTAKGNPSFTEKYLKSFEGGAPIIALRQNTNLINTFIGPLRDEHSFEGRVHAQLNQNKIDDYGTVSGRLSCSNPNLQQVPKHNKRLAKLFRPAFVADEGMTFYEGDWSQAEPRLFAHYSEDDQLVGGYSATPPRDVHTIVAEMLNKDRATTAKRMNMGMFTGMFPKTFADHMGVSLGEATDLWESWHGLFPGVRPFQDLAKNVMLQRGYVKTIYGRHAHMESRRLAYKAVSRIIQGSQADMLKFKMLEIDLMLEADGDATQMLMQVHDSLVWQSPDDIHEQEAKKILEVMANVQTEPFNLLVPFAVDAGFGKNWAEASFG